MTADTTRRAADPAARKAVNAVFGRANDNGRRIPEQVPVMLRAPAVAGVLRG
jgi:hypothetical protein